MDMIIGSNCTFDTDNMRNRIADGVIVYVLYHNNTIRLRTEQLSYVEESYNNIEYDPYPENEYFTFNDKIKSDEKGKVKVDKKKKFITISSFVKKWLACFCSRLAYEADESFDELSAKLNANCNSYGELDAVMFNKNLDFNLFALVAKIVANNDVMIKKYMNIQILEAEISYKIKERYDLKHSMRQYNKNIADWLGKLLDDFFKVIAVHISLNNWFDRNAIINEKNFPACLWLLAENTNHADVLYEFLGCLKVESKNSDTITLDMSSFSDVIKDVKLDAPKKGRANKIATVATITTVAPALINPTPNPASTAPTALPSVPTALPSVPTALPSVPTALPSVPALPSLPILSSMTDLPVSLANFTMMSPQSLPNWK